MRLRNEQDVRRYIAEAVKRHARLSESVNESGSSLGAGCAWGAPAPDPIEEGANDPDTVAATQFARVIGDYINDHVDELANAFVMSYDEDGSYPARIEDVDDMAAAIAGKVVHQLDFEDIVRQIVSYTYKTALGS